ncbi:tyrosine-protein phosphatase [Cellvibrio sp. pealriver]|uniref:tyrosine-protein phosphatase n=1 Tax=Cellvibrio sp. pealriver TaxID=1622269 RepID=UPI00066FF17F|nr:tyrosine-protein phosphatase [Cellvibrio sp. pealriver]
MNLFAKKTLGISALAAALLIGGCQNTTHETAVTKSPVVIQHVQLLTQEQPLLASSLLVTWTLSDAKTPVDIYVANHPNDEKTLVARNVTGNSYLLQRTPNTRQYIFVQPNKGAGQWVAERVLPLEGGFNFRDLGGYRTNDGRMVQWGKIYRSGTMVDLTPHDFDYLGKLNISVMCDFRSREELQHEPTAWKSFAPNADFQTEDYSMRELISAEGALRFDQVKTAEQAQEMFKGFYRTAPYRFKQSLSNMFNALAENKAPLAFNCSAGKDRTGMAAALVLTALDVPRNVIEQDYALTERVANFGQREMLRRMRAEAQGKTAEAPHSGIAAMPAEARNVFMGSDPVFIQAMFAELEKNHGSARNFIRDELKIDDQKIAQIQKLYLTDMR